MVGREVYFYLLASSLSAFNSQRQDRWRPGSPTRAAGIQSLEPSPAAVSDAHLHGDGIENAAKLEHRLSCYKMWVSKQILTTVSNDHI